MSTSQKQAIFNAVAVLFPKYELKGEVCLKDVMTTEQKKEFRTIIFNGFKAGEINMSEEASAKYLNGDDSALQKYVTGLVDNWVRKTPEFNNMFPESGGVYRAKNPGSRAGSGDEQIRALRALKKTVTDSTVLAEIEDSIKSRLAEIKPAQTVEINVDALPEHLRHLAQPKSDQE